MRGHRVAIFIQNVDHSQAHVRMIVTIRLSVRYSACKTDCAEHQSQCKHKRQGSFFHSFYLLIFCIVILHCCAQAYEWIGWEDQFYWLRVNASPPSWVWRRCLMSKV